MIIRCNWICDLISDINRFKVDGITIFPFIILRDDANDVVANHERIHFEQQVETLVVGFYVIYVLHYLYNRFKYNHMKAYNNICFEKEANKNQHNLRYMYKRKKHVWLKEL